MYNTGKNILGKESYIWILLRLQILMVFLSEMQKK